MGDNGALGVVKNEENEELEPKTPQPHPISDKSEVESDEEIEKIHENNSHNAGNGPTALDTPDSAHTKTEIGQKEAHEVECKNESLTSQFQSAMSISKPVIKSDKNPSEEISEKDTDQENSETVLSSQSLNTSNPSNSLGQERTITIPPVCSRPKQVNEKLFRHQSDILPSLKEIPRDEDASLMIFSHKGLPTKKFGNKRREVNSTILPFGFHERESLPTPGYRNKVELTPKISQIVPKVEEERRVHVNALSDRNPNVPTNPNPTISRNVLTGRGVNSLDEFKTKTTRRKDGNPLLGIGYDEPVVPNTTGRVPPGGFSSGLW